MPPYECPEPNSTKTLKFIRVREEIFVGRQISDRHKDIVTMDNLKDKVNYLRNFEPIQVDAGYVDFFPDGFIRVSQNSDTLDLPVQRFAQEARETTVKYFQEQSPNHKVVLGKERY